MKTSRSHSHHKRHHSSASFSKKFSEVHGFGSQASYDDLNFGLRKFGAPITVSCRVEDYYEIFNSSRASRATSIPILDLPQTKERQELVRVKSSEVDYSKIFGGLNDKSIATTYDEMFTGPKREESSSEDAWTPAETGSPSDDSDSLNSYEASHQPFDAKKQVNMSYHKTNLRSKDGTNGTTHIAQLHAVPGFTFVIDEETKLQSLKENEPSPSKVSDATVNMNVSGEIFNVKHHRRSVSDFPNHNSHKPTSEINFCNGSYGTSTILDSFGTGLGTKHFCNGSTMPNIVQDIAGDNDVFHRSKPQNCGGSKNDCFSPSSSDEEVDTNSVAAASAIALRKAITEAQARIRIAKNSLERKNRDFNCSFMSSFKDSLMAKDKRTNRIGATSNILNENCGSTCIVEQNVDKVEPMNSPNLEDAIEIPHSRDGPKGTNIKDYISILTDQELSMARVQGRMKQYNDGLDMDEQLTNEGKEKVGHTLDALEQGMKIIENPCEASVSTNLDRIEQNFSADQSLEENKTKLNDFPHQEDLEESLKTSFARIKIGDKLDKCPIPVQVKENEVEQLQENEYESSLEDAYGSFEIDLQLEVDDEQKEDQHGLEETFISEEHEGSFEYEEIGETKNEDCECREEFEVGHIEDNVWEENTGPSYSYEDGDSFRGLQEVIKHGVDDSNLSNADDGKEIDKEQEEICEWSRNAESDEPQISEDDQKMPGMMGKSCEGLRKRKLWTESCLSGIITNHEEKENMVHLDHAMSESEESIGSKHEDETVDFPHTKESFTSIELEAACETVSHVKNTKTVEETSGFWELKHNEIDPSIMENVPQGDINYDETIKNEGASEENLIFDRMVIKEAILNSEGNTNAFATDFKEQRLADKEIKTPLSARVNDNDFGVIDEISVENEEIIGEDKDILRTQIPCMMVNEDNEVEKRQNEKSSTQMDAKEEKKEMQVDMDVDEQAIRRMNEEKVKERERQEGRIAVERAIREARERAFAETQERVVKAKARDKGSEEALLKTQRSLVERATSEARHRALQKALSEKSTFEGGRDNNAHRLSARKVNDSKYHSSDPPSSSANHGTSNDTERFDGATKGESAQRCQAKLERHHRTVERAAKALAEKNMRDLRVQKEQAERNRLAESLDAEVKRWSSGKRGNLRALLSTLQYILGPESGWHAVPLTEIITAISVKKAYRKAALCVHPDKLQQRGATIQQKYICEKVFDLLKDAWNKFNSEER